MNSSCLNEEHKAIPTTVILSPTLIRAAKTHSIRMGCRLTKVGSLNYFINKIVLDYFESKNMNYRKLYPKYYK